MTGRITTQMLQRNLLADIHLAAGRLSHTQAKLTSGREITKPSDDPAGTSKAMALRESLDGTRQHARNAGDALAWADATETALTGMTDVVQRARELVIAGGSDGADPQARQAIAAEVDHLIAALKEQANTSLAGRRLFSGTLTDTPAYGAGDGYLGDAGLIAREIGPGVSVGINLTAQDLLGGGQAAGDDKLLHALRDIRDHLLAGAGAALRGADLERLDRGLEALLSARAANGALTTRLESAVTRLGALEELTLSSLSQTEDADMAKTLIDLNTQTAAYQAALRSGANIVQSSLMDFLR